jgi:hypothetical protein|tara:strand:- start:49 stop:342 length:294 start_codon:yes stop_codon:yes gene_type:complete
MKETKWSDYAKYIVLADNSRGKLKGDFSGYMGFKEVRNAIDDIAFTDKLTYSSGGDIYNRKITSAEAKTILDNVDMCKWNNKTSKMILVANQLKLRI